MKKYLKEFLIILVQVCVFYLLPLFVGPNEMIGMVFLFLLLSFILSMLITAITENKIKFFYPIIVSIVFIPSVYMYYNKTALVHSIWYLFVSTLGVGIGVIINKVKNSNSKFEEK